MGLRLSDSIKVGPFRCACVGSVVGPGPYVGECWYQDAIRVAERVQAAQRAEAEGSVSEDRAAAHAPLPPVPSGFYEAGESRHRAEMWQRAICDDLLAAYCYARDCYERTGLEADKAAMIACVGGEGGQQ